MFIKEKLEAIFKALEINATQFTEGLEVSPTTITGYMTGRTRKGVKKFSKPTYEIIVKMYEVYNINPLYILDISDEIFYIDTVSKNYDKLVEVIINADAELSKREDYITHIETKKLSIKTSHIKNEIQTKLDFLKKNLEDF